MNSYENTLSEIYSLQEFAIKLGLENITRLCQALGQPQKSCPVIHLAGTNGKGSTAFYTASILQAMGLKVGLFTSPHLMDYRERITINGRKISKSFVVDFWKSYKSLIFRLKATFFDTTTALALSYFATQKVDVAVIETGLGGRLDSTNIVQPEYVALTPIDFDHEKQLGYSLKEIALEKAGIIKDGAAVFCAKQHPQVLEALSSRLKPSNRMFYLPDHVQTEICQQSLQGTSFNLHDLIHRLDYTGLFTKQLGPFQTDNIALAYLLCRVYLRETHTVFLDEAFTATLKSVRWPGRLQVVRKEPTVIVDVSHNLHGIAHTINFLVKQLQGKKLNVLLGLVKDKNHPEIVRLLARHADRFFITEPDTPRALNGQELEKICRQYHHSVELIKDWRDAYELSIRHTDPQAVLLIIGSHYLVGSILNFLN